jgi:hypothetical protein
MKFFLGILSLLIPLSVHATCSQEDAPYQLTRTDRAYEQAMKLKASLERQGVEVTCVLPSKIQRMFDGQLGAAFFRTSVGVLDVMFMPESVDFQVRVVETKKDAGYFYSFEGKPSADNPGWDSNRKIYFIQHRNWMISMDDERFAAKLASIVRAM